MKIAICFSGQPRTWEKCYPTWANLINQLENKTSAKIDTFCHVWDFNTLPQQVCNVDSGPTLELDSVSALLNALSPVSYLIEDYTVSSSKSQELIELGEIYKHEHGGTPITWAASQFYGIMRSAHLKKVHEIKNRSRYDLCIRLRYDLFLPDEEVSKLMSLITQFSNNNTIYATATTPDFGKFPPFRLGDLFWIADSLTFDRMCNFYKWLPVIGVNPFPKHLQPTLGTENLLFYYAQMLRIKVLPIHINPKICRFTDYVMQLSECNNQEGISHYEII